MSNDTKLCPKCSETIQKEAIVCRFCKADLRNWFARHYVLTAIGSTFLLGVVVSALFPASNLPPSTPEEQSESSLEFDDKVAANVCAQNYIESMLKSPSTADFPWDMTANKLPSGDYRINSYVDSQNGFGATVRTTFACDIKVLDAKSFVCSTKCEVN